MASSAAGARVLVVYGSESGTCKRIANAMVKEWTSRPEANFTVEHVCDGNTALSEMSVMEDDSNVVYHDFTSLKAKYDVLVVITSSYGEGDPPANYGGFFVQLLAAVNSGHKPLLGMQHCVLGMGSTVYQETFQNVPRLTDRYLGEAGSRRCLKRQEIDAAHYVDGNVERRDAWRDAVFAALQALPSASAPPACGWDVATKAHTYPTDKVTAKSATDLAEFKHGGTSGATNEQAFGMIFWGLPLALVVAYGYYVKWSTLSAASSGV